MRLLSAIFDRNIHFVKVLRTLSVDEGALDLGTTADGVVSADSLADAAALQADIAAGLAAGIDAGRVTIYSLEGAADREDGADWVALPEPEAADVDDASLEIREVLATLDAIGG